MNDIIPFKDIIVNIIKVFNEKYIGFGKTRLIKIAYLLEILFYKRNRNHLTDAHWIFYKYGPYPINYNDYLDSPFICIPENEDSFKPILLSEDKPVPELPVEITTLINSLVLEYGKMDLNELLNHVYFHTEPMKNATPKKELNFEIIESQIVEKNINFKLSNKNKKRLKDLQKRFKKSLAKVPKKEFQEVFVDDDIFDDYPIEAHE